MSIQLWTTQTLLQQAATTKVDKLHQTVRHSRHSLLEHIIMWTRRNVPIICTNQMPSPSEQIVFCHQNEDKVADSFNMSVEFHHTAWLQIPDDGNILRLQYKQNTLLFSTSDNYLSGTSTFC
jgi:hypothetical protein